MPKKKKSPSKYIVSLTTIGKTYTAEGRTIGEGIAKLGLKWNNIKQKGVIKVVQGKREVEKLYYTNQLKRLFANKTIQYMIGKRLELLLKEKYDNL